MAKSDRRGGNGPTIIIRKEEVVEGGHHGGAWKVAYADFVTAMMAFFLLMWLLNATTEAQRKGLADYFSPTAVLGRTTSGSGQPFGGHTAFDDGAMVSDRGAVQIMNGRVPVPVDPDEDEAADTPAQQRTYQDTPPDPTRPAAGGGAQTAQGTGGTDAKLPPRRPGEAAADESHAVRTGADARARDEARMAGGGAVGAAVPAHPAPGSGSAVTAAQSAAAGARGTQDSVAPPPAPDRPPATPVPQPTTAPLSPAQEQQRFTAAASAIADAVRADPALAPLAHQLSIDTTPEGLRIQILDEARQPMFATGSAAPNERARLLLRKVAPVLAGLTEQVSIAGYTDAAPYPGPDRTNWELSADRANATRRLLVDAGLADRRIRSVIGHADHDLLLPHQPLAAANRRIAIVVLREATAPVAAPAPASAP